MAVTIILESGEKIECISLEIAKELLQKAASEERNKTGALLRWRKYNEALKSRLDSYYFYDTPGCRTAINTLIKNVMLNLDPKFSSDNKYAPHKIIIKRIIERDDDGIALQLLDEILPPREEAE